MNKENRTWIKSDALKALPLTIEKSGAGEFGLEKFSAGIYPSCSLHGAMNRVSEKSDFWRCITAVGTAANGAPVGLCNIGCEWDRTKTEIPQ